MLELGIAERGEPDTTQFLDEADVEWLSDVLQQVAGVNCCPSG
jgi:hypothetical protein